MASEMTRAGGGETMMGIEQRGHALSLKEMVP